MTAFNLDYSRGTYPGGARPGLLLVVVLAHATFVFLMGGVVQRELSAPAAAIEVEWLAPAPSSLSESPAPSPPVKTAQPQVKATHPATPDFMETPSVAGSAPAASAPAAPADTAKVAAPAPILPPRFDAAYLQNPAPAYPPISRRMGEMGRVLLRVLVNEAGRAERVDISQSSGSSRLDLAAQEAVRAWRFVPARQGERNSAAWVIVPINFSLEG